MMLMWWFVDQTGKFEKIYWLPVVNFYGLIWIQTKCTFYASVGMNMHLNRCRLSDIVTIVKKWVKVYLHVCLSMLQSRLIWYVHKYVDIYNTCSIVTLMLKYSHCCHLIIMIYSVNGYWYRKVAIRKNFHCTRLICLVSSIVNLTKLIFS